MPPAFPYCFLAFYRLDACGVKNELVPVEITTRLQHLLAQQLLILFLG